MQMNDAGTKPAVDTVERRAVVAKPEFRATETGNGTAVGYAAVFNQDADIGGWFTERIAPGAFTETLASGADVLAFFDHDSGRILGRASAKTLRLSQDAKGLAVEIDLPPTSDGGDVSALLQRGDLAGMSFGFQVTKQEWDETVDPPLRTITGIELFEVSIVSMPAYSGTSVALRSLEAARAQAEPEKDKRAADAAAARRRVAERKARMEQQFRGIPAGNPEAPAAE